VLRVFFKGEGPAVPWSEIDLVQRIRIRAIRTTSAPSHIYETWCHVAQTCLIIKEMGPERSHNNVSDPI